MVLVLVWASYNTCEYTKYVSNVITILCTTILLLLQMTHGSYLSLELFIVRHAQSRAKFASARNTKPGNPIITIKG